MVPLELLAISNKHKPRFAPGTAWEYCSTCYVLLGLIVEKTTGHTLGTELKRRVFVPAGLKATSFDTEPRSEDSTHTATSRSANQRYPT